MSPTAAMWDARRQAQEKMVKMVKMGLHVLSPEWQRAAVGVPLGARYSGTFTETTLTIPATGKSMSFPVQTCTRVKDLRLALADTCMVSSEALTFIVKQGCNYRKQLDHEELGRKVIVKGISDFKPQAHKWPHPTGVIGAGYNGIKTCCHYLKEGNSNIVCFDRNNKVGGYCWITAANKTSKLQTEMGSFHVWWGPEYATSKECGGWPTEWEFWPKKERVLEHFHICARDYGMLPHVHFRTNVSEMDIIGPKDDLGRYYNLTVTSLDKEGESEMIPVSVMYNYPGSMTKNRHLEYPGEDSFEGHVGYGMGDEMPYDHIGGSGVVIMGNGAFAVENVRTCCELKAKKIYLLTRRKNLPSPRVPCWFVHQGPVPTPGRLVLDMFKPMYSITPDMGDPWDYWSVHAPSDRRMATIIQNSRFGIGDVTFLAVIWGRMEYVESTLKRLTRHTCHLVNGQKLEDVQCIVKSLGLIGDFEVDRLHKMKELIGNWCSGDFRRVIQIDPLGMNAANFTTFSTGIGTYGSVYTNKYLHDFPQEYGRMVGMGLLGQLPKQKADEKLDRPAYVTDVKFQMAAGIIVGSMCPKLAEKDAAQGPYKYELYHRAHPTKKFLEVCKQDWDQYQATWKADGWQHEYVPYPYTYDMVADFFKNFNTATGMECGPEGPPIIHQAAKTAEASLAEKEDQGTDEATRAGVAQLVDSQHKMWWASEGPKKGSAQLSKGFVKPAVNLENQPLAMR